MKMVKLITILTLIFGFAQISSAAEKEALQQAIQDNIKEKSQVTGSLDIFDSNADKVRNLKFLKFHDDVTQEENSYTVGADFRDINNGDIVDVDYVVTEEDGALSVAEYSIQKVTENKIDEELANKTYSDQEIQEVMKAYLDQKSKFTGTFDIYDQEKNKMLNLEFVGFDEKIRKFGKLNISTARFKDAADGSDVLLDLTVENNQGVLKVQSVRIVRK